MKPPCCREVAELLDEMALGTLPGDQRTLVLDHVTGCTPCRDELSELSAVADNLLLACPPVEPPPGFAQQVRTAIRKRKRRYRPRLVAAAAMVAVVAMSGGAAVLVRDGGQGADPRLAGVAAEQRELRTVKLIAANGRQLGDVSVYDGSPAWIFMRVDHGAGTTTYECVLDVDGGPSLTLGELSVTHGRGAWGQHISLDPRRIAVARLVDEAGNTVATASFR